MNKIKSNGRLILILEVLGFAFLALTVLAGIIITDHSKLLIMSCTSILSFYFLTAGYKILKK